jgi:hypothetical protein
MQKHTEEIATDEYKRLMHGKVGNDNKKEKHEENLEKLDKQLTKKLR